MDKAFRNTDWQIPAPVAERLVNETKELADKVNKLQDFMRTEAFFKLSRKPKSLLYKQLKAMTDYLETLGERVEYHGVVYELGQALHGE